MSLSLFSIISKMRLEILVNIAFLMQLKQRSPCPHAVCWFATVKFLSQYQHSCIFLFRFPSVGMLSTYAFVWKGSYKWLEF